MIVSEREIQEFCDRLVKEFNPDKVILFGSYARGEQREWSDVDIMVVMPFEGRSFDKELEMIDRLNAPSYCDLRAIQPALLEKRYREFDSVANDVIRNGKVLYDRYTQGLAKKS